MKAIIKFTEEMANVRLTATEAMNIKSYVLSLQLEPTADGCYSRVVIKDPKSPYKVYQNGYDVVVVIPQRKVYALGNLTPHGFNLTKAGQAGTVSLSKPIPLGECLTAPILLKADRKPVAKPKRKGANDNRPLALQRPSQ